MALNQGRTSEAGGESLATVEEVAAFLQVPPKTIYRWRYLGEGPPGYRVGKHLRFRWTEVESWLAGRGDRPQRRVRRRENRS